MNRSSRPLVALALLLSTAAPCLATNVPIPAASAKPVKKDPAAYARIKRFSSGVRVTRSAALRVTNAACNRRTVGVNPPANQLGPINANGSSTLVAVPIGGSSVQSATRDQQISEVCSNLHQ
jgi:hypothetical protein